MTPSCSVLVRLVALAACVAFADVAHAELTFDPNHPGFASSTVEVFPPAESPVGAQNVTFNRPGTDISLSTTSSLGLFQCSPAGDNCVLLVTGLGAHVTFSPPVSAVGIWVRLAECRPTLTFTGAVGSEQFQFPTSNVHGIFVGALNIGAISELTIVDCFSHFDDLTYVPGTPDPPPPATDLTLTKTGPALFVEEQDIFYNVGVTNQGPAVAQGTNVVDFVPSPLTFGAGFPATDVLAGGRVTVTHFGDLSAGASDSGLLRMSTGPFAAGTCESAITNVALVTSANLETNGTDNLAVTTAHYDRGTRTANDEICGNGLDDNCNGRSDCWDGCNCWPAILPGSGDGTCERVVPPGLPLDLALAFATCAPSGQPAAGHRCSVPRGTCGNVTVPAWCCDPATFSDPDNNGHLQACDLGIPGCVPRDPNFKQAVPAVNAMGYGYAQPGQEITYRLQYENVGDADAHDVEIIDPLHPDLDAATLVVGDGGLYDATTRVLRWTDPVLPPHVPRRVSFSARLRADAPAGTRVRNVGTIVFPDAVPPSRVDTNFVEHVVADPTRPVAPRLRVLGCQPGSGPGTQRVQLVNEGVGFAYNVTATIVDPPAAVQVTDAGAAFAHPDDPEPDTFASVIPSATTDSRDDVAFTTQAPGDVCAVLRWRIRWETFDGVAVSVDVQSLPDADRDAVADGADNCPAVYNPTQADVDGDGIGDACEPQQNQPPDCRAARASVPRLWPPNHDWRVVAPIGVTDPDGDVLRIAVTRVRQDEPVNSCGDGDTAPDAKILGSQAKVRAERRGNGNGRVYHISFTATDPAGGRCAGTVKTCVPRDNAHDCVDGGALYDSTAHH